MLTSICYTLLCLNFIICYQCINYQSLFRLLPDQKWVQCDSKNCLKWRILPDNIDLDALPDKWYCKDHPLSDWRSCDIPEKLDDEKEIVTPYKKEVSKQLQVFFKS